MAHRFGKRIPKRNGYLRALRTGRKLFEDLYQQGVAAYGKEVFCCVWSHLMIRQHPWLKYDADWVLRQANRRWMWFGPQSFYRAWLEKRLNEWQPPDDPSWDALWKDVERGTEHEEAGLGPG